MFALYRSFELGKMAAVVETDTPPPRRAAGPVATTGSRSP